MGYLFFVSCDDDLKALRPQLIVPMVLQFSRLLSWLLHFDKYGAAIFQTPQVRIARFTNRHRSQHQPTALFHYLLYAALYICLHALFGNMSM